jgi:N-acetylglucosamine kinase-like BadF-type ATPase
MGQKQMQVLGIDAGGSKTIALLADGNGHIIGEGRSTGANLHTDGELQVEKVLHSVIEEATEGRDTVVATACLGIAGVDRETDFRIIGNIMRRLGFRSNLLIVNDALIALVAGAGASPGVVIISGTGSIAYGVSHRGLAARAGGWGPTLGDEGSGYWIGRRALAAVVRDVDGRGPRTQLTPRILDFFKVARPELLVSEIYHQPEGRRDIAALAPLVDQVRSDGDLVAAEIMTDAADELAQAAASVIFRLEMRGERFPILLAGGMLKRSDWLVAEVARRMAEVAPRSDVHPLTNEPVIGAVRLAIAAASGQVRVPPYVDSYRQTSQPS